MQTTIARRVAMGVSSLLAVMLLGGCTITPEPEPRLASVAPLQRAVLVTPEVEIQVRDPDGSMPERIVPGTPFRPARFSPHAPKVQEVQVEDLEKFDGNLGYFGIVRAWQQSEAFTSPPLVRQVIPGSPAADEGLGEGEGVYVRSASGKGLWTYQDLYSVFSKHNVPVGERHSYEACGGPGDGGRPCRLRRGVMESTEQPRPYRVLVHVPGRDEPLHGRLAFFHVHSTAAGSAGRIYRLQVPQQYVERARGGNVSVVYQPYDYKLRNPYSGSIFEVNEPGVSWALWLSDVPF